MPEAEDIAFLSAAVHQRGAVHLPTEQQGADAGRPAQRCGRSRSDPAAPAAAKSTGAGRSPCTASVDEDAVLGGDGGDLGYRLQGAHLVVGHMAVIRLMSADAPLELPCRGVLARSTCAQASASRQPADVRAFGLEPSPVHPRPRDRVVLRTPWPRPGGAPATRAARPDL